MDSKNSISKEVADLIPGFLQRRAEDIIQLRESVAKGDYDKIAAIAHKLKGNGAAFGFPLISQTGVELEKAAKKKSEVETLILVENLNGLVLQLKRATYA
jgi:HPt (histidine-containing phosphotransfer) domain-containing protein